MIARRKNPQHTARVRDRPDTLAQRVVARREQLGLSQAEVARRAGYSNNTSLFKIEAGTTTDPKAAFLLRLADALETSPYYLLFGEDRALDSGRPPPPSLRAELEAAIADLALAPERQDWARSVPSPPCNADYRFWARLAAAVRDCK